MARLAVIVTAVMAYASVAWAQSQPAPNPRFAIADNSFLVEEAFNQERGIFQNIFVMTRSRGGGYEFSFTQEWPVPGQRHQLSYTLPASHVGGEGLVGDVLLNYRYQAAVENGHPAFSPRVSLVIPTSADRRSIGARALGVQINLPFSKQAGPVYFHWNAGATWLRESGLTDIQSARFAAASAILAVRPMFHLMFEAVTESLPAGSERAVVYTMAPGLRGGWNVGESQVVIGAAAPITRGDERNTAVLAYFSYELPFRKPR